MRLLLCASERVSIALKPFGYPLHGHDVEVEACWCLSPSERVDVELLHDKLSRALSKFQRKPLWEALGREDAAIEDMLLALAAELAGACRLEARWGGRRIELNF
ncbi:MAG: hypothetical protein N3F67_05595 [Acidilobaceae archaeon]|nr:hypothetical protein [Acidilobaceae archaeon]